MLKSIVSYVTCMSTFLHIIGRVDSAHSIKSLLYFLFKVILSHLYIVFLNIRYYDAKEKNGNTNHCNAVHK